MYGSCRLVLSHQLKPGSEFILGNFACLAGGLHISGGFAPGIEFLGRELPGLHSGEPFFILSAVILEHIVAFFTEGPLRDGPNLFAGAALAVKEPVAVFGGRAAGHSKVPPTVPAYPHPHLSLDTLAEMEVDKVVNGIQGQNFREGVVVSPSRKNRQ